MAEGFANEVGAGTIEVHSAGSRPSDAVNPKAITAMSEIGLDITSQHSKGFDSLPEGEWDAIVTMGCGDTCPFLSAKMRVDWDLPDPKEMSPPEFNKVRDEIHERVEDLITAFKN